MIKTVLSKELLNEAMDHYNEMKSLGFIVPNSLPILFFGDIEKYAKQEFKVITAALNPSDAEFTLDKDLKRHRNLNKINNYDLSIRNYSMFRFKDFDGSIESAYKAQRDYFKNFPYEHWFGKSSGGDKGFQPVLNGMGYCYYEDKNKNIAIHTDVCSPLATCPTWGGLNDNQISKIQSKGIELWIKTVKELKPDLILYSGNDKHLFGIKREYDVFSIYTKSKDRFGNPMKRKFELKKMEASFDDFKTTIIIGRNLQGTPYGMLGRDGKTAGNIIREKLNIKTSNYDKFERENKINNEPVITEKSNIATTDSSTLKLSYFILKKSYIGKNHIIEFNDSLGNLVQYDHDLVLNQLGERITNLNCWINRGFYANSKKLPGFVEGLKSVKIIS